jgi:hypothetical protein
MAKKDDVILIIAKCFNRDSLSNEEINLVKDITIISLINDHTLTELQAQTVHSWITHQEKMQDLKFENNQEKINEIFNWIKNKFKKGKSSKDISPTYILNQLKIVTDSHENHEIFYSSNTNNYLISVIGYTNWWTHHLGSLVTQYFEASTDNSRNKTPHLDDEMSDYFPKNTGNISSALDSYDSFNYVKNVLENYAKLLEYLARAIDHFHTATNIYERKDFSYNKNVIAKLFKSIDEYLKDQNVYNYVGEDKLYIKEITSNNFAMLRLEIKEMVKNLGVSSVKSAKKQHSSADESVMTSMIICTAMASFLHAKSRQIKKYVQYFDTEHSLLDSQNKIYGYDMSYAKEKAIEDFKKSNKKYKRT